MSHDNPSVSEKRWHEGLGKRYMEGDVNRVRCQAVAKGKLRQIRLKRNDPDLTSSDVWPEAQCTRGAIEGTFLCNFHGGTSPQIVKKSLMDFMPIDLQEKFQVFVDNPDLMNRYIEIATLQSRNAQLLERMEDMEIGKEAYYGIVDAVRLIRSGEVELGTESILGALRDVRDEPVMWDEIRNNTKMIDTLTRTQVGLEKDYSLMSSMDQVRSMIEGIYLAVQRVLTTYVQDESVRQLMIREIAAAIRGKLNARASVEVLHE